MHIKTHNNSIKTLATNLDKRQYKKSLNLIQNINKTYNSMY